MARKLIPGYFLCALFLCALDREVAVADDKPSQGYEEEVQPGGAADLSRFQNAGMYLGRRDRDIAFKAPPKNMRKYHDLVGLPDNYHSPITIGSEKLRYSPESIKKSVFQAFGFVIWESWRLDLQREGISWTAEFASTAPLRKPFERGFHYNRPWMIDSVQNTPLGWDASFLGMEELRVAENPNLSYTGLGARPLVHWRLYRHGSRYITPRLKLSDLKEYAPWFYDHIPSYVLERKDWFHNWHMNSMAIYINNRGSDTTTPRMIEFCGAFSFDGTAKQERFDTFFDPKVFRRIHIRNGLVRVLHFSGQKVLSVKSGQPRTIW